MIYKKVPYFKNIAAHVQSLSIFKSHNFLSFFHSSKRRGTFALILIDSGALMLPLM